MIFSNQKYIDILKLIIEGVHSRDIARIEKIHENTVRNIRKRTIETGSAIPSKTRESFYSDKLKPMKNIILSLLKNGRTSYNRYKKTSLTNQEIFLILNHLGFYISKTKTDELAKACRAIIKDDFLHAELQL